MIEKPIYYMSSERPTVEENHFSLNIVSVTYDGAELLAWKKICSKTNKAASAKID